MDTVGEAYSGDITLLPSKLHPGKTVFTYVVRALLLTSAHISHNSQLTSRALHACSVAEAIGSKLPSYRDA